MRPSRRLSLGADNKPYAQQNERNPAGLGFMSAHIFNKPPNCVCHIAVLDCVALSHCRATFKTKRADYQDRAFTIHYQTSTALLSYKKAKLWLLTARSGRSQRALYDLILYSVSQTFFLKLFFAYATFFEVFPALSRLFEAF